ncbi:MAG TPA: phospholipase D family protein [Gaiellaceae bacterium]|nr:phospholipase D family protein [Gaiellaceae bacterium]
MLDRLDDLAGDAVEWTIRAHHRRRLAKLGHGAAFAPPAGGWAATGAFPARAGSGVEVLVDGEEALARIAAEIAAAQSHVHVAGWHFTPGFRMGRGGPTLRELLADAAQRVDVRVLCWAGAPLPLFHPDRREVRRMRDELADGTRIAVALDARERPFHCHHEKLVVVDDRVAFVGGIDLTTLAGDRLDTSDHPPRGGLGWHDAAVRLEGPPVADVAAHFLLRWRALTRDPVADPESPGAVEGGVAAQLVRTVPERVYDGCRRGEFTILESYLRALRAAERFVYLESQFLWSPELTAALAAKLRDPPSDDFRVLVLLPAHPNNGGDDTRGQLGCLVDADRRAGGVQRFLACTLHQPGPDGKPVYVHAKVGIVDDEWLTVGSANLNEHSLFNDTEANVVLRDPELARATRLRLWSEHLERAADGDPAQVFDEVWLPHAKEQAERRERDGWSPHRLSELPNVSRRSRALWGPLNGLLVDG